MENGPDHGRTVHRSGTDSVDNNIRNEWNVRVASDGEFWINFDDFEQYYHDVIFCNLAPEFGENFQPEAKLGNTNQVLVVEA